MSQLIILTHAVHAASYVPTFTWHCSFIRLIHNA